MGKLEVNSNLSPKTFLLISIFATILFLFCLGQLIYNYQKTKDYVKVNATITEVDYDTNYNSTEQKYYSYIIVNYNYNNQTYNNKQRVFFRLNKNVGDLTKIYINPNNPNEIRNTYVFKVLIIATIITGLFTIIIIKCYFVRKNAIY